MPLESSNIAHPPQDGLDLRVMEIGERDAPALLLLHGSGGVGSLGELPSRLAGDYRVLAPSHPGFDGTHRPEGLSEIHQLATLYVEYLEEHALRNVTVVGFSLGGWTAMEMVVRDSGRIGRLILVDPIGVQTAEAAITNPATLRVEEALRANYHDPDPFLAAAAAASEEQRAAQAGNMQAASVYTANGLFNPALPGLLAEVEIPTLVVFGESERIVPLASGHAIVEAVSGPAMLHLIPRAGHRPQLEQPAQVEDAIRQFLDSGRG